MPGSCHPAVVVSPTSDVAVRALEAQLVNALKALLHVRLDTRGVLHGMSQAHGAVTGEHDE